MPIFVSRFSSARSGLANFQALRSAVEDVRADRRASLSGNEAPDRDQEEDQTGSSGENSRGASALLTTTQRADQIAQRITDQNASSGGSERQAEDTRTGGETAASASSNASQESGAASVSAAVSTAGRAAQAALQNAVQAQTNDRRAAQTTDRQTAQAANRQTAQAPSNAREDRQAQTQRREPVQQTRLVIRPVLRSAVQRIDNLTRLLSAQRRGETPTVEATPAATAESAATTSPAAGEDTAGRALVSTSLRIEQTAAQSDLVRTAQAAQVALSRQAFDAATASATQAQQPRAEERIRETVQLKQNLREDVSTVTRGLVRDSIRQNTQNARQIAQNVLQSVANQARPASAGLSRPASLSQRSAVSQGLFSSRRQAPALPNLSGLRSALALLGTNVNILVG